MSANRPERKQWKGPGEVIKYSPALLILSTIKHLSTKPSVNLFNKHKHVHISGTHFNLLCLQSQPLSPCLHKHSPRQRPRTCPGIPNDQYGLDFGRTQKMVKNSSKRSNSTFQQCIVELWFANMYNMVRNKSQIWLYPDIKSIPCHTVLQLPLSHVQKYNI